MTPGMTLSATLWTTMRQTRDGRSTGSTLPRSAARRAGATALSIALLAAVAGCAEPSEPASGQDERTDTTSPSSASTTPSDADASTGDAFAGGTVPATVEVPVDDLPGFEAISFWKGTEVVDGPRQVTGQLDVGGETLLVQASSLEDALARETSEQELRAWVRDNPFTKGPVDVLDPVSLGGAEVLHARGDDGFAQWDRYTLVTTAGEALSVMFSLPLDLPDAEREDYIASVMATVRLR
jgi:hypothetical protein